MSRDSRLLSLAMKLTYHSNHHQYPMAAILAISGHPVSMGINKRDCGHPKQKHTYLEGEMARSTHAELSAIIGVPREVLGKSTLYVARRRKGDNSAGLASPCSVCWQIIREAGIKRVVWTTGDGIGSWRY